MTSPEAEGHPMPSWRVWLLAARPKTLGAGIAPVVVGTAMAVEAEAAYWPAALAALLGALLIQVATNYANDYFDFVKGTDTEDRIGPTRATQAGLVSPGAMRNAMIFAFALAMLPGVYIVYRGGWPYIAIGVLSILFGILYTAGPLPLGYIGLGDLFVLVFFGPVAVCGTYYVQALALNADVMIASLAPGLLSVSLLTVNNLRDIDEDRRGGKKTLAVRFGRTFARSEYLVCMVAAAAVVPMVLYARTGKYYLPLAPLFFMLRGAPTIHTVYKTTDGETLNDVLATTGKLLLLYSVVFAIAWNL